MTPSALRPAWYRLRAALRRDWAGYLAIALIVGILGGAAMGGVAAARRTQSAFPRILASSNPSHLDVTPGPYSAHVIDQISHLPLVRSAEAYVALEGLRALPSGFANPATLFNQQVELVGSLDGLYFNQDRVIITSGRRADPRRPGQVVVSEQTAGRFGLRVGQSLALNLYTFRQANDPRFNPGTRPPVRRVRLTITGIGVFTDEVVQDDIDRIYRILATPALTRQALRCCASYVWAGLRLAHGDRDVGAVQREFIRLLPPGTPAFFRVTSVVEGQGERAVRPESVAAGAFGLIAALAALVLAMQAIRRTMLGGTGARPILRAVGASPLAITLDACLGVIGAIAAGTLLAVAVAIAVSPLAPLGQLHRLEPDPGISADWLVLAVGGLFFLAVLCGATVLLAYGEVPPRPQRRSGAGRPSPATALTTALRLPVTATAGIGLTFERGSGRDPRPGRPSIVATAVALIILVGSLAFGASLSQLVSHPALYGWNWDREMLAGSGYGNIPLPEARTLLGHDPDVAAWSGAYFDSIQVNRHSVPVIGMTSGSVAPPILAGHGVAGPDQIVLGPHTLALVGGHVGGTVRVFNGRTTRTMRVAGTATMPAIGVGHGIHSSLGGGAVLAVGALPVDQLNNGVSRPLEGPNTILVRFRPGVNQATAVQRLERIGSRLSGIRSVLGVQVLSVQRPAEIVNYRTMGTAPVVLAGTVAAGAVLALALTLSASVRRRSRDLALLKTLGLVRGQVVAVVLWQASVSVALGTVIGIPLGIAGGRLAWHEFAAQLYVVPRPFISVLTVAVVAVSALALAVLTALVPGWRAARTSI
ncbi:MAG: putative transport system permease protein, partial [Streptosporangiaceae bacterium]|nr:putative transport system permease protein [Streptosporangiaceae bacterium]